jgi:hypothetical protein
MAAACHAGDAEENTVDLERDFCRCTSRQNGIVQPLLTGEHVSRTPQVYSAIFIDLCEECRLFITIWARFKIDD